MSVNRKTVKVQLYIPVIILEFIYEKVTAILVFKDNPMVAIGS